MSYEIRSANPNDFDQILILNEKLVHYLSPLTKNKLEHLHNQAEFHKVVVENDKVLAFCLALREGKDYDSINYIWFSERYSSFLYVDRIVVDIDYQSKGLGKLLYEEIFTHARNTNVPVVAAEIDIDPPNPISFKFHKEFGFKEIGKQQVAGGMKIVSLQVSEL